MYKATVVSANRNTKNNKGVDLVFMPDGKDKEWKIIDFSGKARGLNAGDRIEYAVEKDGNFWKFTDLTKIHDRPNDSSPNGKPNVSPPPAQQSGGGFTRQNDPDTNKRIQRSVALKASVDLISSMMAHGYIKKTATIDLFNALINEQCQAWESYLTLETDVPFNVTGREPGEEG